MIAYGGRDASLLVEMMKRSILNFALILLLFTNVALAADPVPSWNDTDAKKAIVTFVERVTKEGSPESQTNTDRIAEGMGNLSQSLS